MGREGADRPAKHHEGADRLAVLEERGGEHRAKADGSLEGRCVLVLTLRNHLQVADVDSAPLDDRATGDGSPCEGKALANRRRSAQSSVLGGHAKAPTVGEEEV